MENNNAKQNTRNVILVVDDQEINREILTDFFQDQYEIMEAEDGKQALGLIARNFTRIACVLLDIVMPGTDGIGVLQEMKSSRLLERVPVIMITSNRSKEAEKRCYDNGALDVLPKPFDREVVLTKTKNAIELFNTRRERAAARQVEDAKNSKLSEEVKALKKQVEVLTAMESSLRNANAKVIDTIATIAEFRSLESGYHIRKIRAFTKILATAAMRTFPEYKLTPRRIEIITNAAAMHDVGKITVKDTILLKPGRLTKEEFEIMKSHTTRGCEIVRMLADPGDREYYETTYDICRHHHEKYDGKGYPDGLKGDEISIAAQLVSLADVYDALISDRVYKAAYSPDKAFEMIRGGECGVFAPNLMTCFDLCRSELEATIQKIQG